MESRRVLFVVIFIAASISLVFAANGGVTIKEWLAASPNSFPHDPAVSSDGALWYTGIMVNTLGRLDPRTGK
jgi:streptogramin lyase